MKTSSKPGCPVMRVNGRKVTIDWTPPDSDGGFQITQYVIHYVEGDIELAFFVKPRMAGRSTSCTFSKEMKYNEMYKFAVAAKNISGLGPLSEFSESVKTPTYIGKNIIFIYCYYCSTVVVTTTTSTTNATASPSTMLLTVYW